ncbi:MAG: RiPP maturation radical SAM protein 1 [Acidobacteria bacterium]|nr:MAG: RiPP maturation radical SAM protein 1 [Acidobacteriota bacterium]
MGCRGPTSGEPYDPAFPFTSTRQKPGTSSRMTDVCLVQMPYALVNRPSLGLSLLKSYLETAGLSTRILYANILFAEEIGLDVYRAVEESPPHDLLGEWTFSEAAFGAGWGDPDAYFRLIARSFGDAHMKVLRRFHPGVDLKQLFLLLRQRAVDFVDRCARDIIDRSPRIVGCTSMFHQQVASLALLRRVRQLDPNVITMLGGANCEGPMGRKTAELFPWVDFVNSGEADAYIGSFCRRLVDTGLPAGVEELPEGLFGRARRRASDAPPRNGPRRLPLAGEAAEGRTAPRAVVHNLDATAVPSFDEYFEAFAKSSFIDYVTPTLPIETSRGCWWGQVSHCTFCGLNSSGIVFRSKSPDRVLFEMRYLSDRHGVRRFETADEILDMAFLKTVLPRLADETPYTIFYEVKSNLKRDQLEVLAKAGVREVQPGIENLHDEMLKLIAKGNTGLMNIQFLKWAAELGMRVGWNFLFGAPGECDHWYQEIAERVPLLHHLQPPGCVSRIGYHRFSPYHDDPARFGISLDPRRAYGHVYPVAAENLRDLAYYFEDYGDRSRGEIEPALPGHDRPGLRAAAAAIRRWRHAFYSSTRERPVLVAEPSSAGLLVRDTRLVATAREHRLEPMPATVLRLCRTAATEASLRSSLDATAGRTISSAELHDTLSDLQNRKLILQDRGRFLSVVLDTMRPLPTHAESAAGEIRTVDFARHFAARSLARECIRLPQDVPVPELFSVS